MPWRDQLFGQEANQKINEAAAKQTANSAMEPGLTGNYDWDLREKAGMHKPPPPPECMGLEGELDYYGLAKRVAAACDRDPVLEPIDTIQVGQRGSTVVFQGQADDISTLQHLVEVAKKVDGTRSVDTSQVMVLNREEGSEA